MFGPLTVATDEERIVKHECRELEIADDETLLKLAEESRGRGGRCTRWLDTGTSAPSPVRGSWSIQNLTCQHSS